jgi:hypothetical protein
MKELKDNVPRSSCCDIGVVTLFEDTPEVSDYRGEGTCTATVVVNTFSTMVVSYKGKIHRKFQTPGLNCCPYNDMVSPPSLHCSNSMRS